MELDKREKALNLRRERGLTLQETADLLGYRSKQAVLQLIGSGSQRNLLAHVEARLLLLIPLLAEGDLRSIAEFWKLHHQKAILLGLHAPTIDRVRRARNAAYVRWRRTQTPRKKGRMTSKKKASIRAWEERQFPEWRRAYMRTYMRDYRAKKKLAKSAVLSSVSASAAHESPEPSR